MSPMILIITISTFLTAILSGIFGMAGGLILMTVLLGLMPVAAAMSVHACIQLVSNGWRCFLWRRHIAWQVLPPYFAGMVAGFCIMLMVRFIPDKSVVFLTMGAVPLLAMAGERYITLYITNKIHTFFAATILTFVQMTAGVVGPLLDLLYNNAPLTRKEIVGTKAFTQSAMHLTRLAYFGSLVPLITGNAVWPNSIPGWAIPGFMVAAIAGTSAAGIILHRISDLGFKRATRILVTIVCLYCLGQGIWLTLS
jgi:uncharacterized membrane protein YfcA